jgi:hypothetical protein
MFFQKLLSSNNDFNPGNSGIEAENLQLQKVIMLNIFHILAKYSSSRNESIVFLLELLLPVSIRFPKGILFSCKILSEAIFNRPLDGETQRKVNE